MFMNWLRDKMYIHTMDCYSVSKNEILIHATTWMNFENVMLYDMSRIGKSVETDNRSVVVYGLGR